MSLTTPFFYRCSCIQSTNDAARGSLCRGSWSSARVLSQGGICTGHIYTNPATLCVNMLTPTLLPPKVCWEEGTACRAIQGYGCGNGKKSARAAGQGLHANCKYYLSILFSANLMSNTMTFYCGFSMHFPHYQGTQTSFCMFMSYLYFYAVNFVLIYLFHFSQWTVGLFIFVICRCSTIMGY